MTFVVLYQELIKGTGAVIPPPWEVAGTCIYHCVISLSLCYTLMYYAIDMQVH